MKIFAPITTLATALLLAAGISFTASLSAEDLSDNAVCMDCHADMERSAPEDADKPRIHTDDGGFIVEAHEMWSCIDCHEAITEIPHPDDAIGAEVNCENCHESTPTME